jgi:hypothetical protein
VGLAFGAPELGLGAGVGLGVGVESGAHGQGKKKRKRRSCCLRHSERELRKELKRKNGEGEG